MNTTTRSTSAREEQQHNAPSTSKEPAVLRAETLAGYIDERVEKEAERLLEKKAEELEEQLEEKLDQHLDKLRRAQEAPAPLWTIDDVADYLGVSPRQVHYFLASGQLTSTRVGRKHRFEPKAVRRAARGGLSAQSQ